MSNFKSNLEAAGTRVHIVDSVHVNVLLESVDLVERLAANRTIIGAHLNSVDLQVTSQCRVAQKSLATFVARQRLAVIRPVDRHVFLQANLTQ